MYPLELIRLEVLGFVVSVLAGIPPEAVLQTSNRASKPFDQGFANCLISSQWGKMILEVDDSEFAVSLAVFVEANLITTLEV